ncbi:MAG: hypothetical protein QME51_06760 [Planctomycetota bacterium]|nr:hypothetical protein [Planctomycetota bacterium]MDI6788053.1 hypothetical protein [Planctomycetota bacterium]
MPELKFKIQLQVSNATEPSADMPEKWADGLKTNAERINLRREEVISTEDNFNTKLVQPAHAGWSPMLDPSFVSESEHNAEEIRYAHKKNLANSFGQYEDKLNYLFEEVGGVPAKRFKDAVDSAKHHWAEAVVNGVLRFTGDKVRGRGPAVLAVYWMTNHKKAETWLREGDQILHGTPYNIAFDWQRTTFKAAVQQKLIQAGMQILHAEFEESIITRQNTIIKDILNGLIDPAKCSPFAYPYNPNASFCAYVADGPVFYLDVQIWMP